MSDYEKLLALPFELIWPLAAGYLGYRLAFVGRDAPHKTFDGTFLVFVFASIARLTAGLIMWDLKPQAYPAVVVMATIFAAVVAVGWRIWGAEIVFEEFRRRKVLDHDGQPTVWRSMLARNLCGPTRLTVVLKDGTELMTSQLADFNDAPMGPCLLGEDGSIAMYVTDELRPKADGARGDWLEREPYSAEYSDWGYEMTFLPASEIARVKVTRPVPLCKPSLGNPA